LSDRELTLRPRRTREVDRKGDAAFCTDLEAIAPDICARRVPVSSPFSASGSSKREAGKLGLNGTKKMGRGCSSRRRSAIWPSAGKQVTDHEAVTVMAAAVPMRAGQHASDDRSAGGTCALPFRLIVFLYRGAGLGHSLAPEPLRPNPPTGRCCAAYWLSIGHRPSSSQRSPYLWAFLRVPARLPPYWSGMWPI
jgi:hypothetical protein